MLNFNALTLWHQKAREYENIAETKLFIDDGIKNVGVVVFISAS